MLTCLRCSWEWTPRVDDPKNCPGCRSRIWNVARKPKKVRPVVVPESEFHESYVDRSGEYVDE